MANAVDLGSSQIKNTSMEKLYLFKISQNQIHISLFFLNICSSIKIIMF